MHARLPLSQVIQLNIVVMNKFLNLIDKLALHGKQIAYLFGKFFVFQLAFHLQLYGSQLFNIVTSVELHILKLRNKITSFLDGAFLNYFLFFGHNIQGFVSETITLKDTPAKPPADQTKRVKQYLVF